MHTGFHLQARFTGQAGKKLTWFALGASLPLLSTDAGRAARRIIRGGPPAARTLRERGGRLVLLHPLAPMVRMLALLGADQMLTIGGHPRAEF
jgi:hypothetical protein